MAIKDENGYLNAINNVNYWVIPCNPNYFDHYEAISVNGYMCWPYSGNTEIKIDDIIFLYRTIDNQRVFAKMIVTDMDCREPKIFKGYYNNPSDYNSEQKCFSTELVKIMDTERLYLSELQKHGFHTYEKKWKCSTEVVNYLQAIFSAEVLEQKSIPKPNYDKDEIILYLWRKSKSLYDIVKQTTDEVVMFSKTITHSDLVSTGKQTKDGHLEDNILYYETLEQMKINNEIEKYPTAHQSCISFPKSLKIECCGGDDSCNICDISDVRIITYGLRDFSEDNTMKLLNHFDKVPKKREFFKWKQKYKTEPYIKLDSLHTAAQGIGTTKDKLFTSIRNGVFKDDEFIFIIIRTNSKPIVYIQFVRSPIYNSVINGYKRQSINMKRKELKKNFSLLSKKNIDPTKQLLEVYKDKKAITAVREYQSTWRYLLAQEVNEVLRLENEVMCPFTGISIDFNQLGSFFRASHIKPYASCKPEEAYDINNGLLLSVHADALFDQHLISISNENKLVFSALIEDLKIISFFNTDNKVFDQLIERKLKYLRLHYKEFVELEKKRIEQFNF